MRFSKLTNLAFQLNGVMDSGRGQSITTTNVRSQIRAGTIIEFLQDAFGDEIDLSLFEPLDRLELAMEWEDMLGIPSGRKLGVERNGICLLIAFLLEQIQQARRNELQPR